MPGKRRLPAVNDKLQQAHTFYKSGEFDKAAQLCRNILETDPSNSAALQLLARILAQQGNLELAEQHLRNAITSHMGRADLHVDLGNVLKLQNRTEEALDEYRRALTFEPQNLLAHHNLGLILKRQGSIAKALASFRQAFQIDPLFANNFEQLTLCLIGEDKFEEAATLLRQVIEVNPNLAEAYDALGFVLQHQGFFDEAVSHFETAVALKPDYAQAWSNRAIALQDMTKLPEALSSYDKALALKPDFPQAQWHKSLAHLLMGDYERGWSDYELRLMSQDPPPRNFPYPRWDGSSLKDRTILVYAEQGLGDEIMFASCLPDIISAANHCVIECALKLEPIFRRSFPGAIVHGGEQHADYAWLSSAPPIDVQIPIGSLPLHYRKTLHDFPQRAYLKADEDRVRHWRDKLNSLGPGLKIGISWQGGTKKTRSRLRSIALADWLPILSQENVHFISLQYTPCEEDLAKLLTEHRIIVQHWPEAITSYDETAALVCALDWVISVSTAVIHLCGALGKPAWVMLPSNPEWRYGISGAKMPWYSKIRLFRQTIPGNWTEVIGDVAYNLLNLSREATVEY